MERKLCFWCKCLLQPEQGGRGEGVLYINTEGSFPFKRLVQMGLKRSVIKQFYVKKESFEFEFDVTQCDDLHINAAPDFESVLKCLQQIEIIVKVTNSLHWTLNFLN